MPGRLALGMGVLALMLATPTVATAGVTCVHSGAPANTATFTADALEESLTLVRDGNQILFASKRERVIPRKRKKAKVETVLTPAVCSPVAPTVVNTDRIEISLPHEGEAELEVSLQGGPLAPGATPEEGGGEEIEIGIRLGNFQNVHFVGSERDDAIRFGSVDGVGGVNLNPSIESTPDVDATLMSASSPALPGGAESEVIADLPSANAAGGGGDDSITTTGGPEFDAGFGKLTQLYGDRGNDLLVGDSTRHTHFSGGPGADTIHAARRFSVIFAGSGDDVIIGQDGREHVRLAGGRDRADLAGGKDSVRALDGARDRIRCGGARDVVIKDRKDRLNGCERQRKRQPKFEQPQVVRG